MIIFHSLKSIIELKKKAGWTADNIEFSKISSMIVRRGRNAR